MSFLTKKSKKNKRHEEKRTIYENQWILEEKPEKFKLKPITYAPKFYQLFDKVLSCAVQVCELTKTKELMDIKVSINEEDNTIEISFDGQGIPVIPTQNETISLPGLIFSDFLMEEKREKKKERQRVDNDSDEDEMKKMHEDDQKSLQNIVGKRSYDKIKENISCLSKFTLKIDDSTSGLLFQKTWIKNLLSADSQITPSSGKSTTTIIFQPDLSSLSMRRLGKDFVQLLKKRVYDVAGTASKKIQVHLNEKKISFKEFSEYVELYSPGNMKLFEDQKDDWHVILYPSENQQFQQISFVNSISTSKTSSHVQQVVAELLGALHGKPKRNKEIPIMERITVSLPERRDRRKRELTFSKLVQKEFSIFINFRIDNPEFDKEKDDILATSAFVKRWRVLPDFPKSEILSKVFTEKKKTLVITYKVSSSIREDFNPDRYEVFILKNLLPNAQTAAKQEKLIRNPQIVQLLRTLGLKFDQPNQSVEDLNFKSILFLFNHDADSVLQKWLLIHFLHQFWPFLLKSQEFVSQIIVPVAIISERKSDEFENFFTVHEWENWLSQHKQNIDSFHIETFKYLLNFDNWQIREFVENSGTYQKFFKPLTEQDSENISMVFSDTEKRRKWLLNTDLKSSFSYQNCTAITYSELIQSELRQCFQKMLLDSFPNILDGLDGIQRKILSMCTFGEKTMTSCSIKYFPKCVTSELSRREFISLITAKISCLIQDPNNPGKINLLSLSRGANSEFVPSDFGQNIFLTNDNCLLDYYFSTRREKEPKFYLPILPLIFVNGGIGTRFGWKTRIPSFDILHIIFLLKKNLKGEPSPSLDELSSNNPLICQKSSLVDWSNIFHWKRKSEQLKKEKDDMEIENTESKQPKNKKGDMEIEEKTDFALIDANGNFKQYSNLNEIWNEFYEHRLEFYNRRRTFLIQEKEEEIKSLKKSMEDYKSKNLKPCEISQRLIEKCTEEHSRLLNCSAQKLWLDDLDKLEDFLNSKAKSENLNKFEAFSDAKKEISEGAETGTDGKKSTSENFGQLGPLFGGNTAGIDLENDQGIDLENDQALKEQRITPNKAESTKKRKAAMYEGSDEFVNEFYLTQRLKLNSQSVKTDSQKTDVVIGEISAFNIGQNNESDFE